MIVVGDSGVYIRSLGDICDEPLRGCPIPNPDIASCPGNPHSDGLEPDISRRQDVLIDAAKILRFVRACPCVRPADFKGSLRADKGRASGRLQTVELVAGAVYPLAWCGLDAFGFKG